MHYTNIAPLKIYLTISQTAHKGAVLQDAQLGFWFLKKRI